MTDPTTSPGFRAGDTIYAVDEQGATFALFTAEDQAAVDLDERERGAIALTTFECTAPRDMTADDAADYACQHGPLAHEAGDE